MKYTFVLLYLLSAKRIFKLWKDFRSKYDFGLYYIDKEEESAELNHTRGPIVDINDLKPENYDHAMDLRGTPTHLCPCGCNIWNVKVIFEDFEVATYFLDMECANCGSMATAPTLLDREKME
jgi:hypothetical protein